MRCERAERLFIAYLDRELPARQYRALDDHLAGCARCQARIEKLQDMRSGISLALRLESERVALHADAWNALEDRLARPSPSAHGFVAWVQKVFDPAMGSLGGGGVVMKRILITSLVALLVMGTAVLTIAPVRAWAANVWDALFGTTAHVAVVRIADGQVTERSDTLWETDSPLTLEQVSQQTGFPIWLPGYLPSGYTEMIFDMPSREMVIVSYQAPAANGARASITLYQTTGSPGLFLGGEVIAQFEQEGRAYVWARGESTTYDLGGNPSPLPYAVLYWQQDGLAFALSSYTLPLEEMLRIAASVAPVEP